MDCALLISDDEDYDFSKTFFFLIFEVFEVVVLAKSLCQTTNSLLEKYLH